MGAGTGTGPAAMLEMLRMPRVYVKRLWIQLLLLLLCFFNIFFQSPRVAASKAAGGEFVSSNPP